MTADMPPTKAVSGQNQARRLQRRDVVVVTLALALVSALAVARIFLFQPFRLPSESMRPNIEAGDIFWASKWDYGFSRRSTPFFPNDISGRVGGTPPIRGEIVVFKLPRDNKTDYVKRIIGLPSDRIQMIRGRLVINGTPVTRQTLKSETIDVEYGDRVVVKRVLETLPAGSSYITYDLIADGPFDDTPVFVVPADHYFVMGDNRDNSSDSRADPILQGGVGFVPAENLVGRVLIKDKLPIE